MPRADRVPTRRRRTLLALVAASSLLALGGLPRVDAQTSAPTGEDLFGSYDLTSRATGLQVTYNIDNFLPVSPLVDLTVPEALSRLSGGPSGYGLASLAFPGPLLSDLGAVLSLAAGEALPIPSYPVRAEAFYPSGPTTAEQSLADGSAMRTVTDERGTTSVARYSGVNVAPLVRVGTITTETFTGVEDGRAVSRARTEFGGVDILGGLISIAGIESEVVAVSDGATATTDGGTTVGDVRFLGLAARITEDGLVIDAAPAVGGIAGPLGGLLGPLVGPLSELTRPVSRALQQILAQATPAVNSLLEAAGLRLTLLEPTAAGDGGVATRTAQGLRIDFSYAGTEQDQLRQLIESLPPDLRASLGPVPNPVNLLVETHIGALTLGSATATVQAAEKFTFEPAPPAPSGSAVPPPPAAPVGTGGLAPSFDTPAPDLPPPSSGGGTGGGDTGGALTPIAAVAGAAIPAGLVILLVAVGAPLFATGSRRLADLALAPSVTACPSGPDRSPQPRS